MAALVILTIAFLTTALSVTAVHGAGNLQCNKPNEEARAVPQCPPQKTCRTRDIQVSCLHRLTEQYETKCVCKEGYYRNPGGECVTAEYCDQCVRQNQYYTCRTSDKLCSDINSDDTSSQTAESELNVDDADGAECTPQCHCNPGTARDENNECVPYDQCNQTCGPEEIKDYCPTDCPRDYCPKNELKSARCPQPSPCPKPKCKCRFNYRRADNGTCIPTRDCPAFACKKPFEEYNACPPLCPNGSCGQATPTGRCPAIFGRIGTVLECSPQCRCKKGYWWNEEKVCMSYSQCPGKGDSTVKK